MFKKNGEDWELFQSIYNTEPSAVNFGTQLAVSGDWAIITDAEDSEAGAAAGAIYYYFFDGSQWVQKSKFIPNDIGAGNSFGTKISISGLRSIVGVDTLDKIYFIHFNGTDWVLQQEFSKPFNNGFGISVSMDGLFSIAGAPYDDNANGINAGAIYVYKWDGTNWSETQKLITNAGFLDQIGSCVKITGTFMFVGQDSRSYDGSVGAIFEYKSSNWNEIQNIRLPTSYRSNSFSCGVQLRENFMVVLDSLDNMFYSIPTIAYLFYRIGPEWILKNVIPQMGTNAINSSFLEVSAHSLFLNENGKYNEVLFSNEQDRGVTISAKPLDIDEGTSGNVEISIIGSSNESFQIHAYSEELVAKHGIDFEIIDTTITVPPGAQVVNIPITTFENSYSGSLVYFNLHIQTTGIGNVITDKILVQINNNDFPVSFQALDPQPTDYLGSSLAAAGDWLMAGSSDNDAVANNAGAAYFFKWESNAWVQKQKTTPAGIGDDDRFGISADMDGLHTVVGAIRDDDLGSNSGAVYAFTLNSGTWTNIQKISASDGAANASFGAPIKIDGTKLAVGANNAMAGEGRMYLYDWNGTQWIESAIIAGSNLTNTSHFGSSVDLNGDWLAVGAIGESNTPGGLYIFKWNGSNWVEQDIFLPIGSWFSTDCAYFISIEYPWATMGCPDEGQPNGFFYAGSVYIYYHDGASWSQHQILKPNILTGGIPDRRNFGSGLNFNNTILSVVSTGDKTRTHQASLTLFHLVNNLWTMKNQIMYPISAGYVYSKSTFSSNQVIMNNITYNGSEGILHSFPIDP